MQRTPQQFKRLEVKKIIDKVLKDTQTYLAPVSINVEESIDNKFTTTDFTFRVTHSNSEIVSLKGQKGKGFVDGLFIGLHHYFSKAYNSLDRIRLADYSVNPLMSKSKKNMGTDAQASVSISVHTGHHSIAEFQHTSRSMIYSSFAATLQAFQFYINCDRCFHKIQLFVDDAEKRNRGDVMSQWMYDLSRLTEVNTYDERQKS